MSEEFDGYECHYDIIIIGTGLIQGIVSSALSKSGKKVLHIDSNDYYGEEQATLSLNQFLSRCDISKMSVMKKEINNNSTITSPEQFLEYFTLRNFDHGLNIEDLDVFSTPHSIEDDEITISSSGPFNNLNAKIVQIYKPHIGCPSCYGYLMERTLQNDPQTFDAATLHPSFFGYVTDRKLTQSRAMHQQRNFNIDVTPKLVLAAGKMVDCIVSSGVGNYLEFKCIDNIFYATGVSGTSSSPDMNNKISNNNKNNSTIQLWKIPSSKSDIFNTKLFNALEKRKLMKLIQDAIDYGKQYDDENIMCSDIMKLNEIDLAKGRSLHRPQNKVSTIKNILSDNSDNLKLQKFIDYMKNVDKFSHSLQQFVLHGLCLESSTDISAEEGLLALYRHINASGRYGTTSFLSTVYGTSEFSQAFCRLSAVWGGIFILQKEVIKLLRNKITQKVFGAVLSGDRIVACDNIVCSREWACQNQLITAQSSLPNTDNLFSFKLQRTSICSVPVLDDTPTGVMIIPPNTHPSIANQSVIYVIQQGYNTLSAPFGSYVIQVITFVHVASVDITSDITEAASSLMDNTMKILLERAGNSTTDEVFYRTSLRKCPDRASYREASNTCEPSENVFTFNANSEHLLYLHDSIVQAENIVRNMYPDDNLFFPEESMKSHEDLSNDHSGDASMDCEAQELEATLSSALQTKDAA